MDIPDPNNVHRGPMFTAHPTSLIVVEGESDTFRVSFECLATGNPTPSFQMMHVSDQGHETEVTSLQDGRYTINSGKLTIQDPDELKDSGRYYCTAHNEFGKITSDTMYLSFGCNYILQFIVKRILNHLLEVRCLQRSNQPTII